MFRNGPINDETMTLVYNAASKIEADQIKVYLEANGIPALLMDRVDSGQYLRILGYGSPYGMDIYVAPENAGKAEELIKELLSETEVPEEELERLALESDQ